MVCGVCPEGNLGQEPLANCAVLCEATRLGAAQDCVHCRAPRAPREENILYLDGEGKGLVNNACFPSTVASSYAPPGEVRYFLSLGFIMTVLISLSASPHCIERSSHSKL